MFTGSALRRIPRMQEVIIPQWISKAKLEQLKVWGEWVSKLDIKILAALSGPPYWRDPHKGANCKTGERYTSGLGSFSKKEAPDTWT
jgi:hypothetical protein